MTMTRVSLQIVNVAFGRLLFFSGSLRAQNVLILVHRLLMQWCLIVFLIVWLELSTTIIVSRWSFYGAWEAGANHLRSWVFAGKLPCCLRILIGTVIKVLIVKILVQEFAVFKTVVIRLLTILATCTIIEIIAMWLDFVVGLFGWGTLHAIGILEQTVLWWLLSSKVSQAFLRLA